MDRLSPEVRDFIARARIRIQDLERENAELRARVSTLAAKTRQYNRYDTEEERLMARRMQWRRSKRRNKYAVPIEEKRRRWREAKRRQAAKLREAA